jgi:hypothetical protein
MPNYIFENPDTGEVVEVFQHMTDKHEYIKDGITWSRVFSAPNASIDTQIDPNNSKAFVKKTDNKGMKLGDMWDLSKDLSDKRAKKYGKDPVKEKAIESYRKKTAKEHPLANK